MTSPDTDRVSQSSGGGYIPPLRRLHLALQRAQVQLRQLRDQYDPDAYAELRGQLQQIADDAAAAVRTVLADTAEPRYAPVRINELVGRVVHAHDATGERVLLQIPSLVIRLDESRLERILDTLLIDALNRHPNEIFALRVSLADGGMHLTLAAQGGGANASPSATEHLQHASVLAAEEGGHLQIDPGTATIHLWLPSIAR